MRECGEVLGVASRLPPEARSAKHILEYIFSQIVDFKKFNQVSGWALDPLRRATYLSSDHLVTLACCH